MKNQKRRSQKILACAMALVCSFFTLTGCGKETEVVMDENVYVKAAYPESGSLTLNHEFIGTISPEEAVYIVPLVSAEVKSSLVEAGDHVKAGDILCQLDSEAAQLQLESAQASYHSAQASANQNLGGMQSLQDYQTQSGITQLEKQINTMDGDLTDSKNDYTDTSNDLDAVSQWEDDAEEEYKKAATNFNTANAFATKFSEFKGSNQGGDYIGCTSLDDANKIASTKAEEAETEIADIKSELEADALSPTLSEDEKAELNQNLDNYVKQLTAAKTLQGIRAAAKEAGFSSSDLTSAGLSMLSNKMTMAQAEYQNAATQKATLEAKKDGYDSAVEQMEDGLDSLKDNLETAKNTSTIQETEVKPQTKEVVEAQLGAASVGIKSAQMQLDMYTLTAPISGVVEAVNVTEHGFATSGNAAYVISNKDTMTANFTVSEGIRNTLQAGQKVSVERNGRIFEGVITEISSMVDSQTGLFQIKASVENSDSDLLTGSSVKIKADTYRAENTLILPYDCVYYENNQSYVYVVENGLAVRKNVETGIFNETSIAVLTGITKEEQVIITWASNLREGAKVVVTEPEAEAVE